MPSTAPWTDRTATTEAQPTATLAALERLLNDPTAPLDADRVWALLAEISQADPGR